MVYKNMLLPMAGYGDVVLSSISNINKKRLQILQNKCLRCASGKTVETRTNYLHTEACLSHLEFRREQHILNFMYDQAQNPEMLKGKTEYSIRTRSSKKRLFKIKRPFTEKLKKKPSLFGA